MSVDRVEIALAVVETKLEKLETDVTVLLDEVVGTHGEPGLRMQVDRLQQLAERRTWYGKQVLIVMLGLLVKTAYDVVMLFIK